MNNKQRCVDTRNLVRNFELIKTRIGSVNTSSELRSIGNAGVRCLQYNATNLIFDGHRHGDSSSILHTQHFLVWNFRFLNKPDCAPITSS